MFVASLLGRGTIFRFTCNFFFHSFLNNWKIFCHVLDTMCLLSNANSLVPVSSSRIHRLLATCYLDLLWSNVSHHNICLFALKYHSGKILDYIAVQTHTTFRYISHVNVSMWLILVMTTPIWWIFNHSSLFLQFRQNTSAPFPRNYKRPGWSIVVKWVLNHSRKTVKITHWLMNNPVIVLWHCCDIHFSNSTFNSKLSSLQVSFANSWKVWPSSWLKPSTIWSAGVCSSQACSAEAPSSGSAGTSSSTPFSTTGRSSATSWTQCVCFPTQTHLCQFQVRESTGYLPPATKIYFDPMSAITILPFCL